MRGNRTGKGCYQVQGTEPVAKLALAVKLPISMDAAVRERAQGNLSAWLKEAIAEKLEREQQKDVSA